MTIFKKYAALFLLSSFAIGGITAQTITSKSPHSDAHKQLLANQAKVKTKSDWLKRILSLTSSTILNRNPTFTPKDGTARQ